jgi:hypothetical protein
MPTTMADKGVSSSPPPNAASEALLHDEIARSARRLIAFLETNRTAAAFRFPFSSSFPRNCCEGVSMIFSLLLEERYGLKDVAIVRGTDPHRLDHHFWVRADGRVYDLTAHQFHGCRTVLGGADTRVAERFTDQLQMHEPDVVDRGQVISLYRLGIIPF